MKPLVQLEMHKLGKLSGTKITSVRLLTGMKTQMSLQIRCRTESLFTDVTLMWLLSGVNQMMLLKMRQLGERFRADVTLERSLA